MDARAMLMAVMRAADVGVAVAAAVLAFIWRDGTTNLPFDYRLAISVGALLALNAYTVAGIYDFRRLTPVTSHLARLAVSWSITILLVIAAFYLVKRSDEFSRTWLILWYFGGFFGFLAVRGAAWVWILRKRASGVLALNVVVVGLDGGADALARRLRENAEGGTRIEALVPGTASRQVAPHYEDEVLDFTRRTRVDEVVIALRLDRDPRLNSLLRKLGTVPIDVKLCPILADMPLRKEALTMPMSSLYERPLAGWSMMLKRGVDLALSGILLIIILPLLLVVATVIAVDSPGPVIFRQLRYGFNNQAITIYKFRTMVHDAAPDPTVRQASANDPRLTRLGKFLRRTSIDELPQLLNVLKGEMSLVGPRPHAVAHNEKYAKMLDDYLARHRVKPGITGWAQVNGLRGETATLDLMKRRVDHDLYYIAHWSLLFDLRILMLTLSRGFTDPRAY
jgi:Undecaprenyl-phosphate glucose phosphotransferase